MHTYGRHFCRRPSARPCTPGVNSRRFFTSGRSRSGTSLAPVATTWPPVLRTRKSARAGEDVEIHELARRCYALPVLRAAVRDASHSHVRIDDRLRESEIPGEQGWALRERVVSGLDAGSSR